MLEAALADPLGLVGSLLEKKYRIDRRVAEGGFGVVYAGRHIGLARPLAIKVLKRPADTAATAWGDMIGGFLEEAKLVARLRHPAVVGVIDAGVTRTDAHPDGLAWIVMEWLDGETLAADLAQRRARGAGGRTRAETLALLRPVVDAVAEAHHAGIVHRDLTPNNVMLCPGRHAPAARILDFGIAKVMRPDAAAASGHTTTRGADRAFSLAYAAPEQLSGARTGPWTDVHALGLMITELLVGHPALPADDVDAHYRATFAALRPTPAQHGVDAGAWEPVLARALALDAPARYASAGELLAALEAAADESSAPAVVAAGASAPATGASLAAADAATARASSQIARTPATGVVGPGSSATGVVGPGASATGIVAPASDIVASGVTAPASGVTASGVTAPASGITASASGVTPLAASADGVAAHATSASAVAAPRSRLRRPWLAVTAIGAVLATLAIVGLVRERTRAPVAVVPAPACSAAACSRPGAPGVCRPDVGCVALRSVDCEPLADARALASDATVWLGAMFPRTGPDATWGAREVNAVELARRDFAQVMSGASAADTGERVRPFGVLACDDAVDYHRAARHLADAGVPAVIGLFKAEEAIDLTTSLFIPRRILAIASLSANPLVTMVPHPPGVPRLVWRTTYNSAYAAAAIATWIAQDLEPSLRATGPDLAHRALRIALVRPRNAAGDALGDAFLKKLQFNGASALDNGASYRELTTEAEAPKDAPAYARIQRELLAFAPDIILYAANTAIVDALFAPLEAQWPATTRHRPRYISVASLSKPLLDYIGTDHDRRGRFFGVTPVSSTTTNVRFVTHYNDVFPDDPITRTINPNSSYDAFYVLAYASYAIPRSEPITGDRLARAFARLVPPGTPIDAGIAGIFDAYAALSADRSIDFTGATGKHDFDLATGESAFDQAILCVGSDPLGKPDGVESGLVYVARSKQLTGKLHCP